MFRNIYKSANDEIKGNREILEQVYLKAYAQKKSPAPIFRYSFATTAIAAVIIAGAVFANTNMFTDKIENMPRIVVELPTEETPPNEIAVVSEINGDVSVENDEDEGVNTNVTTAAAKPKTKKVEVSVPVADENISDENIPAAGGEDNYTAVNEELGISVLSIEDELGEAYDGDYDEGVLAPKISTWGRRVVDEESEYTEDDSYEDLFVESVTDETIAEDGEISSGSALNETAPQNSIEVFSYMYDLSRFDNVKKEGFVNTDVYPITNADEAVERAENEYGLTWESILVYYDPIEAMWKVSFYNDGNSEGCTCVYINSDGITQLIVICE